MSALKPCFNCPRSRMPKKFAGSDVMRLTANSSVTASRLRTQLRVARIAEHIDVRTAVAEPDHRSRIADELLDTLLVILLHDVLEVEIVFHGEIEEGVESVGAAHLGNFIHRLSFVLFQRRIRHLENLDSMPMTHKQMRALQAVAELAAKLRVNVNLLLRFDRLIEDASP